MSFDKTSHVSVQLAEELPDDETPVNNELQELIPGLLKAILLILKVNIVKKKIGQQSTLNTQQLFHWVQTVSE
ncbi:hypothetical protein FNW02_06965 [Komarekiella sp. 'clone 1']|uniref:Uncharacterized protein n=1 Tax=Komarekiella delphini-convector SJRDD-AB1 TaxID=2593771 RepID=A0AA40VPQ6_9NOST|nr:hypothetical protein [Komarekiella delphini-convector]MBD6615582.1 hypothetical protein [Komarekiella delphini-convector SJRDD-AB1]